VIGQEKGIFILLLVVKRLKTFLIIHDVRQRS